MSRRHRFQGDPQRFDVVAQFIYERFGRSIQYIAGVAARALAESARVRPTILFYGAENMACERIAFDFRGPKNIGIVSQP